MLLPRIPNERQPYKQEKNCPRLTYRISSVASKLQQIAANLAANGALRSDGAMNMVFLVKARSHVESALYCLRINFPCERERQHYPGSLHCKHSDEAR